MVMRLRLASLNVVTLNEAKSLPEPIRKAVEESADGAVPCRLRSPSRSGGSRRYGPGGAPSLLAPAQVPGRERRTAKNYHGDFRLSRKNPQE